MYMYTSSDDTHSCVHSCYITAAFISHAWKYKILMHSRRRILFLLLEPALAWVATPVLEKSVISYFMVSLCMIPTCRPDSNNYAHVPQALGSCTVTSVRYLPNLRGRIQLYTNTMVHYFFTVSQYNCTACIQTLQKNCGKHICMQAKQCQSYIE